MEEATNPHPHGRTPHDFFMILMKRRWTILLVFVCVFTVGALRTLNETPIYRATVQLLIERQAPRILGQPEGLNSEYSYSEEFYQTHYKLLEGKPLARKVVQKLDLKNNPYYSSIFKSLPPNADESMKQRAEESLIGAIAGGITVTPVAKSSLVNISFSHPDPKFATTVVNALAQGYIEQSLELRFAASQEAETWLKQKLVEGRKKLEDSEAKLNEYKRAHNIVALDDKESITVQKLEKLNQDLLAAQTRRMEVETRFKEVSQGKPISEMLNNPLITTDEGAGSQADGGTIGIEPQIWRRPSPHDCSWLMKWPLPGPRLPQKWARLFRPSRTNTPWLKLRRKILKRPWRRKSRIPRI